MGSAPSIPQVNPGALDQTAYGYNTLAGEQTQAGSNVNQFTPYGSLSYTQTGTGPGGIPTYTASTQLSPEQQALLNYSQANQAAAGRQAGQLLHGAQYGSTNPATDIGTMTSGTLGQQMSDYMASVAPYQQQALGSEEATLANQGLTPGNKAYDLAMQNFVQGQNQANLGAAAQFEPTAYSQALQNYELPAQMAESLFGMGQPASLSSNLINTPTASYSPVNAIGAQGTANQAAIQQAQLQEQQYGSELGGLFGLGTAAIKAFPFTPSDRRLKENIRQVGQLSDGQPIYAFNYKDDFRTVIGLMADEVEKVHPEAVAEIGGFKAVDYDLATRNAVC